ncbi:hypothetical protein O6072_18325 [Mycolicibacterium neoaurum]|uniref:hypothetical protein n=1 Tax=Mycolicibacterium neoaurum TaxID=1795 RepID=UPI00248B6321|nr:hypothetical protein [Mycolicibacterium neoaurum]WBP93222.1 hypothetical protein O7W24_18920 [Mycolicibacterium neoaurum]WBS06811.1 hypothetical protein O6072_18325 [Mycolicibacterium neoaurum]
MSPSGERLSSFSRNQCAAYIVASIVSYLNEIGPGTVKKFRSVQVPDPICESPGCVGLISLEDAVLRIVASDLPIKTVLVENVTDAIIRLPAALKKRAFLFDMADAIRELSTHYLVLVDIPFESGKKNVVQLRTQVIKRTIPLKHYDIFSKNLGQGLGGKIEGARNSVRRLLGVRPAVVSYPLANSRLADSYHIEIKGPEGTYLGRQRAVIKPNNKEKELDGVRCAMQARFGQRHSHLYIHGGEDLRDVYFENHFFERVPGSVGRATMTCLAALVLIVLCAFSKLSVGYLPPTDLMAVLLAVPAVAGAWAGLGGGDEMTGESLVARISQLETFVASLATALLFAVLPPAGGDSHDLSLSRLTSAPWGWAWVVIVAAQIFAFIAISLCWTFRGLVQESFIRREAKENRP